MVNINNREDFIMAYNIKDEKQQEFCMVPKNDRGEYFRVARVIPPQNRMESIDIRLYYTDDSGDVRPTKKGVRVHTEALPEVVVAIFEALSKEEKDLVMEELQQITDESIDSAE